MNGSMQSSPDPLSASQTFQSPPKSRRAPRVRTSLSQGSSPKKQTFELDIGNKVSPQKIRVTVEGTNDSDIENAEPSYNAQDDTSPCLHTAPRRREHTITTTIPLKGLSDGEGTTEATPKRGRGRPKKAAGTPIAAKKKTPRASTPVQRGGRRKSIGDLVDGDDEDDINFQLGGNVETTRGKGRSRSRSRKATTATARPRTAGSTADLNNFKRGRGRPKSLLPEDKDAIEEHGPWENNVSRATDGFKDTESMGTHDYTSHDLPSPRSNVQSVTPDPIGDDLVIARFEPGNETPHRTGWSSPRVIEAHRPSSSRRRSDNYPSPSSPSEKTYSDPLEKPQAEVTSGRHEEEEYEDEANDGLGELYEFDTILESEGFSMISVDSVPSLREHKSSPLEQTTGSSLTITSNKSPPEPQANRHSLGLESLRETPNLARQAKFSPYSRIHSLQNEHVDDSFSSIPPEILEAATPARQQKPSKPVSRNVSGGSDGLERKGVLAKNKRLSATIFQAHEDYDDSFSAIPDEILEAATPAAGRRHNVVPSALEVPVARLGISRSTIPSPAGAGILTPDETPSPPADTSSKPGSVSHGRDTSSKIQPQAAITAESAHDSSFTHSQLPSSPPSVAPRRYTYTAHLRQHRHLNPDITQTPSIVFSSPTLPPPINQGHGQISLKPVSEQCERPALSPIARTGRMLQDIMVPSSPRNRSYSLGSPFKSPAAERYSSSSAAAPKEQSPFQERRAGPLPKQNLSSHFSMESSKVQKGDAQHQEDPFKSDNSRFQRSPSPEERDQYSLGVPQDRRYSDPQPAEASSNVKSNDNDGDMSWQAEKEITLPDHTHFRRATTDMSRNAAMSSFSSRNVTVEERWTRERAEVVKQVEASKNVVVIGSDDNAKRHSLEFDEDEGFGQLLETLNSSSPVAPKEAEPAKDFMEKPRRGKIPSPWRKNSRRMVYSDKLSQPSSPPQLSKVNPVKDLAADKIVSQPITVRHTINQNFSDDSAFSADMSGWQIPQKANFKPRPREGKDLDVSALLGGSPLKPLPVLSRAPAPAQLDIPSSMPASIGTVPSSVSTDQPIISRTGYTPIPQKQGFNPRPRSGSASVAKVANTATGLFSNKNQNRQFDTPPEPTSSLAGSAPLTASSPSRTNALPPCRTPSAQISSLDSDQESSIISRPDKGNVTSNARTLKWTESLRLQISRPLAQTLLPPPNQSPTKSCLRSPMKTPSSNFFANGPISPSKAVAFVSSSPLPTSPSTLSSKTWSQDHWRLLDSILQQWKPENQQSGDNRRQNSTRVISKLLGKTVSSQGERLVLEQWHLEVVDEFRGVVPGCEEKVIAMRVFSLVVGEEKRALRAKALAVEV